MNVAPSRKAAVYVVSDKDEVLDIFRTGKLFFESLAYASESFCQKDKTGIADDAVSVVLAEATVYIPFSDLVDISAEIERLKKEQAKLEGELKRSQNMLSNEKFLSKAPAEKIAEEKEKDLHSFLSKDIRFLWAHFCYCPREVMILVFVTRRSDFYG